MSEYTLTIIVALIGFLALAVILLVPVYRFLKREERIGEKWTEEVERRRRIETPSNGSERPNASHE